MPLFLRIGLFFLDRRAGADSHPEIASELRRQAVAGRRAAGRVPRPIAGGKPCGPWCESRRAGARHARARIKPETGFDRFCKSIGLAEEWQTKDEAFDRDVFILCDDSLLLRSAQSQRAAARRGPRAEVAEFEMAAR